METRIIEVYDDLYEIQKEWPMVHRLIKVQSIIKTQDKTTREIRYYITSLQDKKAESLLTIIREHWKIENSLHYVKDVAFLEDFCRMRTKQIPQLMSLIRSAAINLLNINGFENKTRARKLFAWEVVDLLSLKSV